MNILMLGGTRFMGRHCVRALLKRGHSVTIATRGRAADDFGDSVSRLTCDRLSAESLKALPDTEWDAVIDSLAYASNDARVLLENVSCKRYVFTSSTAVYAKRVNTVESDFDPLAEEVKWCSRPDFPYDEIKRQAERAVFGCFGSVNAAAARFPFAIGEDDYTRRLFFYVEHIMRGAPMYCDNIDSPMAFVFSDEAGAFSAFLAESDFRGAANGASAGAISIREIAEYVEKKTARRAIFAPDGDPAPYNGEGEYTINTDLARSLGFKFSPLRPRIYALIDSYINLCPY